MNCGDQTEAKTTTMSTDIMSKHEDADVAANVSSDYSYEYMNLFILLFSDRFCRKIIEIRSERAS